VKQKYKLYAALHEDIAEGFVWLEEKQPRARCIVKITNRKNGRSVFCEALQIERNFETLYNKGKTNPKYKIEVANAKQDDSSVSPMVISHWYRAKLSPDEPLKTQCEYCLEIKAFHRLPYRWWGMLRACMHHPQVVVRVGVWLGLISLILGVVSLFVAFDGVHFLCSQWGRFCWWVRHFCTT
jgi:hypothetical protein